MAKQTLGFVPHPMPCTNIKAYFDWSSLTFVMVGLSCDSTELWRISVVLWIRDPVYRHSLEVRRHGGLWRQEWWNQMSVVCGPFSVCNHISDVPLKFSVVYQVRRCPASLINSSAAVRSVWIRPWCAMALVTVQMAQMRVAAARQPAQRKKRVIALRAATAPHRERWRLQI